MKYLKTCIAVSLDGFIARKDGDLDWMPDNIRRAILATYETPGIFLMGVNTYNMILDIGADGRTKVKRLLSCPTTIPMLHGKMM